MPSRVRTQQVPTVRWTLPELQTLQAVRGHGEVRGPQEDTQMS